MSIVLRWSAGRIQLRRGDHEELPRRALLGADPVVGDREHVVAGPLVVAHEQVRRELAVGVRRVCMQRAAQPDAVALKRGHTRRAYRSGERQVTGRGYPLKPRPGRASITIRSHFRTWRVCMEDYEAQEQEFWRKLAEEDMSRSQMLKRSMAAAAGLTILSSPGVALAARRSSEARPAAQGQGLPAQDDRREREEGGQAERDRAAAGLVELRRDHLDVLEEVRHPDHERQPGRQLRAGEPGDRLAQGRLACAGRRRRRSRRSPSQAQRQGSTAGTSRRRSRRSRAR